MNRPSRLVLLGDPVSHSLSPVFQNAALKHAEIPVVYEPMRVDAGELPGKLRDLKKANAAGNVTVPHKLAAYREVDRATIIAVRVGAINTFWVDDGLLHGDNTDVEGFTRAIVQLIGRQPEGARVVVFGAGGAAGAVLAALEHWVGASALIISRDPVRAANILARFGDVARVETDMRHALSEATLVVNATPIGQRDDSQPCDVSLISPRAAVMDLVYRVGETPWVNAAKKRGLVAADGLPMLVEQGALSFQRWFGTEPNREVMQRSLTPEQTA
ncbi:MAG TPA: shikimate dehydrogenase [Gemmatimonadaceae bacterium]|nr:shikimate dehydrogenase [Gemmatimonadaceae bacterium]